MELSKLIHSNIQSYMVRHQKCFGSDPNPQPPYSTLEPVMQWLLLFPYKVQQIRAVMHQSGQEFKKKYMECTKNGLPRRIYLFWHTLTTEYLLSSPVVLYLDTENTKTIIYNARHDQNNLWLESLPLNLPFLHRRYFYWGCYSKLCGPKHDLISINTFYLQFLEKPTSVKIAKYLRTFNLKSS